MWSEQTVPDPRVQGVGDSRCRVPKGSLVVSVESRVLTVLNEKVRGDSTIMDGAFPSAVGDYGPDGERRRGFRGTQENAKTKLCQRYGCNL